MSRSVFFTLVLILGSSFAFSMRITQEADKGKRCVNPIAEEKTCEEMRLKALEIECITEEEYVVLKRYGSYPSCTFLREINQPTDRLDGWCACGCFHPDTLINLEKTRANKEEIKVSDLLLSNENILVSHVQEGSHLGSLLYKGSAVRLKTYGKEQKKVYEITSKSGRSITLTSKHPVLIEAGLLKQVKDLNLEDTLVLSDGTFDPIEKIKRISFKKDVMNFSVETEKPEEHLVFANDFIVGDQYLQSSFDDFINSVLIRK